MATAPKSETLPSKDSVLKKDPLPVIEIPPKKVVLVKESSKDEKAADEENQQKQSSEMEVDNASDDVIGPSNQT